MSVGAGRLSSVTGSGGWRIGFVGCDFGGCQKAEGVF